MAVEPRFEDTALELTGEEKPAKKILPANCPHHNQRLAREVTLPLGGVSRYYICLDCQEQWQNIEEVPTEGQT